MFENIPKNQEPEKDKGQQENWLESYKEELKRLLEGKNQEEKAELIMKKIDDGEILGPSGEKLDDTEKKIVTGLLISGIDSALDPEEKENQSENKAA